MQAWHRLLPSHYACIVCLTWKQTDPLKQAQRGDCGACWRVMVSTSSPVCLQACPCQDLERGSSQDDGSGRFYSFTKALVILKFESWLGVAHMQMWCVKLPRVKSFSPKIRGKFAISSSCTLSLPSSLPDSSVEVLENVDHMVKAMPKKCLLLYIFPLFLHSL